MARYDSEPWASSDAAANKYQGQRVLHPGVVTLVLYDDSKERSDGRTRCSCLGYYTYAPCLCSAVWCGSVSGGDVVNVSFRPLAAVDLPLLARWQSQPHVARWWRQSSDLATMTTKYLPRIKGEVDTEVFVIVLDGRPVGLIQRYRHRAHPEWDRAVGIADAAGIDYYLGEPETVGRGIGSQAIRVFARDTLAHYADVHCVVAAPQQANVASWRALEKAGFVREWAGILDSDDPSDEGPAYIYVLRLEEGR